MGEDHFDVPTNDQSDTRYPVLSGALYYDVSYWAGQFGPRRRTAKQVEFDLWRPFETDAPVSGKETRLETKVRLSKEIEE
jgi:hypothetical protein